MRAALGLGSNEGDRIAFLRQAIRLISQGHPEVRVLRASPIYESAAMLPTHAPADGSWDQPFLNLALECETALEPPALLAVLQNVERRLGRETRSRWAPRRIDIDILATDGLAVSAPGLLVPHPGLFDRPFALLPLSDLWPSYVPLAGDPALAERARAWRFQSADTIPFGTRQTALSLAETVGILNVTPDSFSDGGLFLDPARARDRASELLLAGATVLDIGAESTRPGAIALGPEEEWVRLAPVLESLQGVSGAQISPKISLKISVDTRHAETARRALQAGASWINDVGGLESAEMRQAVVDSAADLVVMHSLGIPPDAKRTLPEGRDPVEELLLWGQTKLCALAAEGITRERVILDPGIGFGKLAFQSWLTLSGVGRLHELGCRLLVGHSRKSFLGLALSADLPAEQRDLESAVIAARLAAAGVHYLRVHDVASTQRALRTASRLEGITRWSRS